MFIDGKSVFNVWTPLASTDAVTVWLKCGSHAVEFWYYASTYSGATINLKWESATMLQTVCGGRASP